MVSMKCVCLLALSAFVALAGCGGGGSDGPAAPPATDTGSAKIGAAGGTVATGSGTASATFPANALTAETTVTIAPSTAAPANARLVSGTAFDFGPSGSFAQPATLSIKYLPTSLPAGALESRLVLYTAVAGAWQPVAGSAVNAANRTVSAPVSHFSTYAILADNQFAGSYAGTFNGSGSGTWAATVDTGGAISATASGGFVGAGSVSFTGASTIPLSGSGQTQGMAISFGGSFTLQADGTNVAASGTWSSNRGDSGNWVGSKQ